MSNNEQTYTYSKGGFHSSIKMLLFVSQDMSTPQYYKKHGPGCNKHVWFLKKSYFCSLIGLKYVLIHETHHLISFLVHISVSIQPQSMNWVKVKGNDWKVFLKAFSHLMCYSFWLAIVSVVQRAASILKNSSQTFFSANRKLPRLLMLMKHGYHVIPIWWHNMMNF